MRGWGLRTVAGIGALLCATASAAATGAAEAARFLTQATFGPTSATIAEISDIGFEGWLDSQFNLEPSLHRPEVELRSAGATPEPPQSVRQEVWWRHAITAPDQLRQRVAFALSEILVVSDIDSQLQQKPLVLAEYYDILVRGALGNYRSLLENMTLSPAMGVYLSMIRNNKPNPASGRRPDENFAREIMQLFTIGLWQLNADGTPKLDAKGSRIPTYDQRAIENFARVYTGWAWDDSDSFDQAGSSYAPMKAYEANHDTGSKELLDGTQVAAGQSAAADLKIALDNLFNHPNVGPFLAQRLIQRLVSSNPSPAYVQRVAQAFNDNGTGVRGDLRAVVRAILLDTEARSASRSNGGKLREPLLRLSAVWRAFNAAAGNGRYFYDAPERDWGQAALRSPSVFNFFSPEFRAAGAIAGAGLVSPEFQIQTESRSITMINAWTRLIRNQASCPGSLPGGGDNALVLINICDAAERAASPSNLLDHLNLLLLYGEMPAPMRELLLSHLQRIPAGDGTRRAIEAIFLIAVSPQFAVLK